MRALSLPSIIVAVRPVINFDGRGLAGAAAVTGLR